MTLFDMPIEATPVHAVNDAEAQRALRDYAERQWSVWSRRVVAKATFPIWRVALDTLLLR